MLINYYLVFPFNDSFEEPLLGAVERQAAAEQNEEDDSAAPHVHRLAVGLSFHHLWCHEVWGAHSPCNGVHVHVVSRGIPSPGTWAEGKGQRSKGRGQEHSYAVPQSMCTEHADIVRHYVKSFLIIYPFPLDNSCGMPCSSHNIQYNIQ